MMNCRFLTSSSSINTLRPALPSIFVMLSIAMFLLGMLDDTEQFQILVQRLNKSRYLHRAPAHHIVDLYNLVEPLDLFSVVEMTQIPPYSFVYLLAGKLVPARRRLTRTGARAYSHNVLGVRTDLPHLFLLRLRRDRPFHECHVQSGERVVSFERLHVPQLDHPFPFIEVVVQELRKEDRAVFTAGERKPAYNESLMLVIAARLVW